MQNVEATPGDIIDQVHDHSKSSYIFKPNVVVINVGTNDCARNIDVSNVGTRMMSLLEDLWAQEGMGNTLIILSTLLPSGDATCINNRGLINDHYIVLVRTLRYQGRPISIVNMDDWLTINDIQDGTHPTDYGYIKMANAFWYAIEQAAIDNMIPVAAEMEAIISNTCDKVYGSGTYAGGLTQKGSGLGDGIYYHDSEDKGIVLTITSDFDRGQWFFARYVIFPRGEFTQY